jgi:hypothetical protein
MRRRVLLLAATVLLLVIPVSAGASDSYAITIEVPTYFDQTAWTFTAYGEAVDNGLICGYGTVTEGKYIAAGRPDGGHWNFHIEKVFECGDGTGAFTVNLKAHVYFDPYSDVGTWNVLRGTGEYAHVHGSGALYGTPLDNGVLDVYTGMIHAD